MSYVVVLTRSAEKAMHKAPAAMVKRIADHIQRLVEEPRPPGCVKLTDSHNRYRLRIGDWRILYSVDDGKRLVTMHSIAKRDKAYR